MKRKYVTKEEKENKEEEEMEEKKSVHPTTANQTNLRLAMLI